METPKKIPTMRRVIWNKIIEAADERTLTEIVSFLIKPPIVLGIAFCMRTDGKSFDAVMQWRGFFVPILTTAIFIVYGLPILYRIATEISENIIEQMKIPQNMPTERIEGIATESLIDFLFERKSYRRAEVESYLKIPRDRVTLLGDRLEQVGILTRGENNARVLGAVSREQVTKILAGKTVAEEIEEGINIVRPTPLPSHASPSFTKRLISTIPSTGLAQTA